MQPINILICPEHYPGGLSANQAAHIIADALTATSTQFHVKALPLTVDNHTVETIVQVLGGQLQEAVFLGRQGRPERVTFGLVDQGRTAILVPPRLAAAKAANEDWVDDMTSFGTGQLLKLALQHRTVERVFLYLTEGTWPVDGGAGFLQALGVKFLDRAGDPLGWGIGNLARLDHVDFGSIAPRVRDVEILVGCDVLTSLLGKTGAAQRWGTRAGASAATVGRIEQHLTRLTQVFQKIGAVSSEIVGAGAGGGLGYGLAMVGAKLVNPLELLLSNLDFEQQIAQAQLVITGQAQTDRQIPPHGVVSTVLQRCQSNGTPVVVLSGSVNPDELAQVFGNGAWAVLDTTPGTMSAAHLTNRAKDYLYFSAQQLGRMILLGQRLNTPNLHPNPSELKEQSDSLPPTMTPALELAAN